MLYFPPFLKKDLKKNMLGEPEYDPASRKKSVFLLLWCFLIGPIRCPDMEPCTKCVLTVRYITDSAQRQEILLYYSFSNDLSKSEGKSWVT